MRTIATFACLLALLPPAAFGQDSHDFNAMCKSLDDLMKVIDAAEKNEPAARNSVWDSMTAGSKCFFRKEVGRSFFIEREIADWPRVTGGKNYRIVIVRGSFFGSKDAVYSFKRIERP
jgi:hypothetical protein